MSQSRHFTPYELNQLHRFGLGHLSLSIDDQTPVEYLTHHAEFYHRDFYVNQGVLIPRLDTEKIINLALEYLTNHYQPTTKLHLADLCTGSGCLGITLLLELQKIGFTDLHLTLSDLSSAALAVARLNLQKYHLSSEVTSLESDLFDKYPHDSVFDIILSNPPYIPTARLNDLDSSVKDHEPHLALDGGSQGTTIINHLLSSLTQHSQIPSLTLIEIDHEHKLTDFQIPTGFVPKIIPDDQDQPRFLSLTRR